MNTDHLCETIEVQAREYFAVPHIRRTGAWLKDGTPIANITIAPRRNNQTTDFDINIHATSPDVKARINEFDYIVVCAENGEMYRLNDATVESKRQAQLRPSQEWMRTGDLFPMFWGDAQPLNLSPIELEQLLEKSAALIKRRIVNGHIVRTDGNDE